MRVKKVRGTANLGLTGVVMGLDYHPTGSNQVSPFYPRPFTVTRDCDIQVKYDYPWVNLHGTVFPADTVSFGQKENFEPIIPEGAAPSEFETVEDLLSSFTVEIVK